jgi:hypothetical protein
VNRSPRVVIFEWGSGRLVKGRNLANTVIGLPAGGAQSGSTRTPPWGPVETEGQGLRE